MVLRERERERENGKKPFNRLFVPRSFNERNANFCLNPFENIQMNSFQDIAHVCLSAFDEVFSCEISI